MSEYILNRWYTAETLAEFIKSNEEAKITNKRFCYKQLMGFLLNKGKDICALYGIRRTGKTVLMLQSIRDLMEVYHIPEQRIAYITIGERTEWDDKKLVAEIDILADAGVRYVFVDEITYLNMSLEENSLNLLADRLAKCGIKIMLAGKLSYAIRLLAKNVLFDRMQLIDTSYFSYKEAHDIFGRNLDSFIKYGGVINFDEDGKQMSLPDSMKRGKNDEELKAIVASLIRITLDNYMKALVVGRLAHRESYRFSDIGKLASVIRQRSELGCLTDETLDAMNLDVNDYYQILSEYLGASKEVSEDIFLAIFIFEFRQIVE